MNDQAILGVDFSIPPDPWFHCSFCQSSAFDVTATAATVIPEPATMGLMGSGLLGVFAIVKGRRPSHLC